MCRTSICRLKTTLFPPSQMENFQCTLTRTSSSEGKSTSLSAMAVVSGTWYVIITIRSDINTDCESDLWQIVRHGRASLYYNVKTLQTFPTTNLGRRLDLYPYLAYSASTFLISILDIGNGIWLNTLLDVLIYELNYNNITLEIAIYNAKWLGSYI